MNQQEDNLIDLFLSV